MSKLSVIITTKNNRETIEECIKRVLKAPPEDKEVIVVYGKSTDGTEEIIRKFDGKVKIIRDDNSTGSAINTGILNSKGEIIAYVEGHSFISNDFFLTLLKVFDENPDVGYVRLYRYVPKDLKIFNPVQKLINFWRLLLKGSGMGQFRGIRRKTFFDVGGFWVFPNGWEEVDFVAKMSETRWKSLIVHSKCWDYPRAHILSVLKKFRRSGGSCSCYFHKYYSHPWSRKEFGAKTPLGMLFNILVKRFLYAPIYALKKAISNRYLSFFPFYTVCEWSFALGFMIAKHKWWGKERWDNRIGSFGGMM